jgi:hypothetical protein
MKKLRACLEIVERWQEGKVVELTFNCGDIYRYTDFEMLDESIYDNDNLCVAVLLDANGIRTNGMAQFDISEIVKVVDVENGQILYEV